MLGSGVKKPSARAQFAFVVATFFAVLICGLITSAGNFIGGTGGALRLAWRVEGTVTVVAAHKPGGGP